MYDWANSGFGLVVITAVFPHYFIRSLLPLLPGSQTDHGLVLGSLVLPASAVSGLMNSLSMFLMAVCAPVLGAIADIRGWTRRLLIVSATAGSVAAMLMTLLGPGQWLAGALLFVVSNFCFGTSFTFYNAFLPRLAPPEKQGSLSGWGFAMGYIGGALLLIICLMMVRADPANTPLALGLSGAWWLLFSLPAFFLLPEYPGEGRERGSLLTAGFRRIGHTFRNIRQYRMLFLFLIAFLLYNDGVETVISMSPVFGTDVLKVSQEFLIVMILVIQFVAFLGAVAFGYLANRIGNKRVIEITLVVWVVVAALAFFVQTPTQFMWLGVMVGLVLGGVQAASRSLMALLAPPHMHNEAFGFFAISGKFASIMGPLMYAALATGMGPRWGIFSVLPFLVAGLVLLLLVREPRPDSSAAPPAP